MQSWNDTNEFRQFLASRPAGWRANIRVPREDPVTQFAWAYLTDDPSLIDPLGITRVGPFVVLYVPDLCGHGDLALKFHLPAWAVEFPYLVAPDGDGNSTAAQCLAAVDEYDRRVG